MLLLAICELNMYRENVVGGLYSHLIDGGYGGWTSYNSLNSLMPLVDAIGR